jgi:hypothetical protein
VPRTEAEKTVVLKLHEKKIIINENESKKKESPKFRTLKFDTGPYKYEHN